MGVGYWFEMTSRCDTILMWLSWFYIASLGRGMLERRFQKKKKTIIWKTWLDVQKRSVERPFRLHTWNRNIDNINLRFISRIIWLSLTNCSHNPQIPFQKCKGCIVVRRTYSANKLQSFWHRRSHTLCTSPCFKLVKGTTGDVCGNKSVLLRNMK